MELLRGINRLDDKNVAELFRSVSWGSRLAPEQILKAVCASSHIVTAWEDDKLVGIARSMDDGIWSANIDCIVVHSSYHRRGIAKSMLKELMEMLKEVQFISVAPNEEFIIPLYTDAGFKCIEGGSLLQLKNIEEI